MVCIKNPESALPPGFRFHPTDEELIHHYLKKKVASMPFPVSIIADVDIYKFDPWDLPGLFANDLFWFILLIKQYHTCQVNNNYMLFCVALLTLQPELPSVRKSGTSSVLETESTRMEPGQTGRLHPGIGRLQARIRSYWHHPWELIRKTLVWRKLLCFTKAGLLRELKLIGLCMSIALLIPPITPRWGLKTLPWG